MHSQWRRAIRLLDLMWQCGGELCPDIVSYNTVIKACGNAAQIDMGFKVRVCASMRVRGQRFVSRMSEFIQKS